MNELSDCKATLKIKVNGFDREYQILLTSLEIQYNQEMVELWDHEKCCNMPGKLMTNLNLNAIIEPNVANELSKIKDNIQKLRCFELGNRKLELDPIDI